MIAEARNTADDPGAQRGEGATQAAITPPAADMIARLMDLAKAYIAKGQAVPQVLEAAINKAMGIHPPLIIELTPEQQCAISNRRP